MIKMARKGVKNCQIQKLSEKKKKIAIVNLKLF